MTKTASFRTLFSLALAAPIALTALWTPVFATEKPSMDSNSETPSIAVAKGNQPLTITRVSQQIQDASFNEIYAQCVLIEQETNLFLRHFGETTAPLITPINTDLHLRHLWYKFDAIFERMNALRRIHRIPAVSAVGLYPTTRIEVIYVWAQTQRMLTEMQILRRFLGIRADISPPLLNSPNHADAPKQLIDVFNKLHQIQNAWDIMLSGVLGFSVIFAETMRLNDDIDAIINHLAIIDRTAPPPTPLSAPTYNDIIDAAFLMMTEVEHIQLKLGIDSPDIAPFHPITSATVGDILSVLNLALAEMQPIKAKVGLRRTITPPAEFYDHKKSIETLRLIGYLTAKLRQIRITLREMAQP
ncbi:putative PilJ domain-containing protein [Azospirillaceae bacterium]